MKRFTFTLAMLLAAIFANAQDNSSASKDEITTLFGKNKDTGLGWFVGFDNGYTQFASREVYMSGFNVGLVINHELTVGFSGSGWTNRNSLYYPNLTDTTGAYLEGGFCRFLFEYTLIPKSAVHLTFPLYIGWGGASYVSDKEYYEWDGDEWDSGHKNLDTDIFFSVEPGVRLEINVLKFMKINGGVSYRFVNGLELINTPANMMDGLAFNFGMKFGKF
jgi:hypothetical protein